MKSCRLTITTVADGRENSIVRDGEMDLSVGKVSVVYREENASVYILLQGEGATVERVGDYSLRLNLRRGEFSTGEIGLGGSSGGIETYAHKIDYAATENSLLLSMHYDLIISGETQKIKLRLLGRYKD